MAKKADRALAQRRLDDILTLRLEGKEWTDISAYVRAREKESGSPWFVGEGEEPLSPSQIRRYKERADDALVEHVEQKRERKIALHIARRHFLYMKGVEKSDLRTAANVLKDLANLEGLYPPATAVHAVAAAKVEMTPEEEQQIYDWLGIPRPRGAGAPPKSTTKETPRSEIVTPVTLPTPAPVEVPAPAPPPASVTPAFDVGAALDAIAASLPKD
jgi:hypothetical protein